MKQLSVKLVQVELLAQLLKKIQQIEQLLTELKLEVKEILEDEQSNEVEGYTTQKVKTEEPSVRGLHVGDRVKFWATPTTRGGYGVITGWTTGKEPFARIERENSSGNKIILRKPHKISLRPKN